MSTDLNTSFNEQYMNINTKLKKRFMRKPNILEATNEFIALAIQCEHSEQPAFAAHAYIGAAKCENSTGNYLAEAEHYITAARQFMKAEKKLYSLKFHSPDRENLEAAIGCFMQAISKYPDDSPMKMTILMEISNDLTALNKKQEAVAYYEQALELVQENMLKIMCMVNLMNLQSDCEKYEEALDTANKICDTLSPVSEDILAEVQISRILLTLVAEPREEKKPPSLKQLFIDVMNDKESNSLPFNVDLRLKLQSMIFCSTANDFEALATVVADLKPLLTYTQKNIANTLIGIGLV